MKATIKITRGSQGWWLTPDGFFENDRETPLSLTSDSADELRRVICKRTFNLYRWGGEEGPHGPVSVGFHSLLVSFLAGRLATVRDCSDEMITAAKSIGAAHDLGERLGPGDIVSPILRACPEAKAMNEEVQRVAYSLFERWGRWSRDHVSFSGQIGASQMVKDADHLAAAIERRYLFDDFSGDCESADACRLWEEVKISEAHAWASAADLLNFELACGSARFDAADDAAYYARELEKAIKCEL